MRKILPLLSVLLLYCALAIGQTKQITGIVKDDKGVPVAFATVIITGTTSATQADANGRFTISANKGATLTISAVNFKEQRLVVSDRAAYDVVLSSSLNTMDEVIVTAGGIKARRKEIGTANSVIRAESLTAGKATNVAGGLQGKVAGMQINNTSGGVNPSFRIVLRGQRSLTGNNQALIVLDNVVVPSEILGNLNPEDVDDIVVLNGAGAAALYGSQASNGAIIVTTKKVERV